MNNILIVDFRRGTYAESAQIWQWDYGRILRIKGLDLPKAVEIHYSNGGDAITRIGITESGVTEVAIPDILIEQPKSINAYVYITDEESGVTTYTMRIPVRQRAKPEAFDRPEDREIFEDALLQLREDLEQLQLIGEEVKSDAEKAELAKQSANDSAESASFNAQKTAEDVKTIDGVVQNVTELKAQAENSVQAATGKAYEASVSANNASLSENNAKFSETEAEKSAVRAKQAKEDLLGMETRLVTAEEDILAIKGDLDKVNAVGLFIKDGIVYDVWEE